MKVTYPNIIIQYILTLYPTWFRWKAAYFCHTIYIFGFLYIPHGSDERHIWSASKFLNIRLYIPHGSDERSFWAALSFVLPLLYIPHGSDESPKDAIHKLKSFSPLYPTWFRWKCLIISCKVWYGYLYIPHGSDESLKVCQGADRYRRLYIPHGSDESYLLPSLKDNPLLPLYPTWFRWKGVSACLSLEESMTFISHMVQMKACIWSSCSYRVSSLYPTWFRWKG